MFAESTHNRKAFYLTNPHGDKLLKLAIKNEAGNGVSGAHAQIKIIGYGTKQAWIWADRPNDPQRVRLAEGVELTYHGAPAGDENPKVHLKAATGYKQLIDNSLQLPASTEVPVPLFAFECGVKNQQCRDNPVVKKAHVVSTEDLGFVRVDFYLAGSDFDFAAFKKSMYYLNIFVTQDYLAAANGCQLVGVKVLEPIPLLRMGDYVLMVKRSVSQHRGRPHFCFYSNRDYYSKLMNRAVIWKSDDDQWEWSTMAQEDERLRHEFDEKADSNW